MSATLNTPAIMPTREVARSLKDCTSLNEAFRSGEFAERIKQSLPRHLNSDAMLRVYVQAVSRTPLLLKCDLRQSIGAFLTLSQLGLAPNNPLGEAYLIPFAKNKFNKATKKWEPEGYDLNVVIGYKGYLALAFRSGMVGAIHADVVWPGDEFEWGYGTTQFLNHKPLGRQPDGSTPLNAYAVAHLKENQGGVQPFRVLPWSDVLRARNGSQAYQMAAKAKEKAEASGYKLPGTYTEAPWVKHIIPMAMKTAWLRLSTWVPRSLEMANAQIIDEAADRGARVDFSGALEGSTVTNSFLEADEPVADGDTAFGVRDEPEGAQVQQLRPSQEQPRQEQPRQEPQQDQRRDPPRQETKQEPPRAHFDAYLVNEDGELAEEHGRGGHFTDAVLWAEALVKMASRPGMKERIVEANRDDMEEANLIPAAAEVIRDLLEAKDASAAPSLFVEVPQRNGKPYWPPYLPAAREKMDALTSAEAFAAFEQANATTLANLPSAVGRGIAAEIDRTRQRLGIGLLTQEPATEQQSDGPPDDGAPPAEDERPDPDIETAQALMADIRATRRMSEFNSLRGNAAMAARMRGLRTRRPDLAEQIDAQMTRHEAALNDTEGSNGQ